MNSLYRTRMCKSLKSDGRDCIGGKCTFAHTNEDLRCAFGLNCNNGSCSRIHTEFKFIKGTQQPLKRTITTKTVKYVTITTSDLPINTESSFKSITKIPSSPNNNKTRNLFFKTQMCHNLSDCKFGQKCHYAHSKKELKPPPPCNYGTKCFNIDTCKFSHSATVKVPWPEVEVDPNRTTPICIKTPALNSRLLDYTDSDQDFEINFLAEDDETGVEETKESGEPESNIDFTLEALLAMNIQEQERLLGEYILIWKKENDHLEWGDQSDYMEPWKSLDKLIIA